MYLQLFKSDQYKVLAEKNRISLRLIPPLRGKILDRNNNIIALNKNSYNVLIEDSENISEINKTLKEINQIIYLNETEINNIFNSFSAKKKIRFANNYKKEFKME